MGKVTTFLHVKLPNALHGFLKGRAQNYGGWKPWLRSIEKDLRSVMAERDIAERELALLKNEKEILEERVKILQQRQPFPNGARQTEVPKS